MRRVAICMLALAFPVVAQAECLAVSSDTQYCGDLTPGAQFLTETILPDLVAHFRISEEPAIYSSVVMMPYDRDIESWRDVEDMVFDQIMFRGTAPYATMTDMSYEPGLVAGFDTVRISFVGRHADGGILKIGLIEAFPSRDGVVMIITSDESADTHYDRLTVAHQGFLGQFELKP